MGPGAPSMEVVGRNGPAVGGGGAGAVGPLSAEEWGMVSRFALGALTSQGTMGGLLLSGLVRQPYSYSIMYQISLIYIFTNFI